MSRQSANSKLPVASVLAKPVFRELLRRDGFAVEYFPGYVNQARHPHRVDCVLLSFSLRGSGRHYLGDDVYEEVGGSLGIVHYGQFHDIVTGPEGMDVINVYLDLEQHPLPPVPVELRGVLADILPLHPAFQNRLNRMVHLQFADPEAVGNRLFAVERELRSREPGHREAARLHFSLFLIDCCRQAQATGVAIAAPAGRMPGTVAGLEAVRRRLDAEFAQEQGLAELARLAGMTPPSLCRAFRRYTGKTISAYRVHRRVQEAVLRLRGSDDKILGIALECGFRDLAYFNRTFKRLLGSTPRAYRAATR